MSEKPLSEMTPDEIAALAPEQFKALANDHNDGLELREAAREREIALEEEKKEKLWLEFGITDKNPDELTPDEMRHCRETWKAHEAKLTHDLADLPNPDDEMDRVLAGLLEPRPASPPPFDPKHAREDLTPARRSILSVVKDVARAAADAVLYPPSVTLRAGDGDDYCATAAGEGIDERPSEVKARRNADSGRRHTRDDRSGGDRW